MSIVINLTEYGAPGDLVIPDESEMLKELNGFIDSSTKAENMPDGIKTFIVAGGTWVSSYYTLNPCLRIFMTILPRAALVILLGYLQAWIASFDLAKIVLGLEFVQQGWLKYQPFQILATQAEAAYAVAQKEFVNSMQQINDAYYEKFFPDKKAEGQILTQTFFDAFKQCKEVSAFLERLKFGFTGLEAKLRNTLGDFAKVKTVYERLQIILFWLDFKKQQVNAWIGEIQYVIANQP